jgi:predicted secreted hydrolase
MKKIICNLLFLLTLLSCGDTQKIEDDNNLELSKVMGGTVDGDFSRASEVIDFNFPQDHGPHPDFRTEWWYITGNLSSDAGNEYGYQFTIFRTALTKNKEERKSKWNSNQIYMGHFALTDIGNGEFYFDERFSREGNELAGARSDPFRVWLEDWQIIEVGDSIFFDLPQLNVNAKTEEVSIDLTLSSLKPYVLQGNNGLSQKGKDPGNASYYYSYTRLETVGQINLSDEIINVEGNSWLDREWSTSALGEDQQGWDWFALQLNDNTEIMYYQMRKKDGTADIYSKGIYVGSNGKSELLRKDDVQLNVFDYWSSPSGSKYPPGWELKIPQKEVELKILPNLKEQLMDVTVTYWEGSVSFEGSKKGEPISGKGYVELTGY